MIFAPQIAKRFDNFTIFIKLDDAAGINVGEQPVILWQPTSHSASGSGAFQHKIVCRRSHAKPSHPETAIRGAVDIVGIARHVAYHTLQPACIGPSIPISIDAAFPGFGKKERLAVVCHAHAVWIIESSQQCFRFTRCRIINQHPAGRAVLNAVGGPFMRVISSGGIREINFTVRTDIQIVWVSQSGVINHRQIGAIRFC